MTPDSTRRLTGLIVTAALAVALAGAPSASAIAPKGDFAPFAQCPVGNPAVNFCVFAQSFGGEFQVGTATVPIDRTITMQGGIVDNERTGAETFVAAANGATLSNTALTVPGGLLGIVAPAALPAWLRARLDADVNRGLTGVTVTAELVALPAIDKNNLLFEEGTALRLPVRAHLSNPFLGGGCYIGSAADPIVQNLTSGTTSPPPPNRPLSGRLGELEFKDELELVVITDDTLVDNAYATPAASGCGGILAPLVDPAVDLKLGLPSAAGHNATILSGTLQEATVEGVRDSEG